MYTCISRVLYSYYKVTQYVHMVTVIYCVLAYKTTSTISWQVCAVSVLVLGCWLWWHVAARCAGVIGYANETVEVT